MDESQGKAALRLAYRRARRALPAQQRQQENATTVVACLSLIAKHAPVMIASYCATPYELDLAGLHHAIWDRSGKVLLPRISAPGVLTWHAVARSDTVCLGEHGFPEPDGRNLPALLLEPGTMLFVPGVAFSASGVRLGQGGGYYDRLLPQPGVLSIGVGFTCQRCDQLAPSGHDRHVDGVILGGTLVREPPERIES